MDFVNIINDKYRSPIDNRVLIRRLSKDPIWSIIKSKYSFCTKTSHIIYCLENDVTELPMCVHCGNRCNTPMASLCSARCSGSAMINNIKFHNKGKTQSQDVRDKISKSLSGRKTQPCSEETKEKIRKGNTGKKCQLNQKKNHQKQKKCYLNKEDFRLVMKILMSIKLIRRAYGSQAKSVQQSRTDDRLVFFPEEDYPFNRNATRSFRCV